MLHSDKTRIWIVAAMIWLVPYPLQAQDLRAVDLEQGKPAPFTGKLLTTQLALNLGMKAEKCAATAKLELDRVNFLCDADKSRLTQLAALESQRCRDHLGFCERQLVKLNQPLPWYRSPTLWFAVGVVTTVGAIEMGKRL